MIALTQPSCHNRLKSLNSFSVSLSVVLGAPLRLAGVFELQLTPHPGSVIGIVALAGGTPEFRVLQQLEPADDLRATLFRLHRLARRLAVEEGKRVIQGAPIVIIQVGVYDLFGHLGRQLGLYERRL